MGKCFVRKMHPLRTMCMFEIVIKIDFQSVFLLETYQNNVFIFIFQNLFFTSTSKRFRNTKKKNEVKKKHFFSKAWSNHNLKTPRVNNIKNTLKQVQHIKRLL